MNKILFIGIVFFFSCKSSIQVSPVGIYKNRSHGILVNGINYFRGRFVTGSSLEIKKDSTFIMHNCGNEISGIWSFRKDTIYFINLSNKFNNDSINSNNFERRQPKVNNTPYYSILKRKKIVFEYTDKKLGRIINELELER